MKTRREAHPVRDQVFVSYSHVDKRWLDELEVHLKPYVRLGTLDLWSDRQIPPGARWRPGIQAALARAKVAVLLVSPDFLASEFIARDELPPLLEAAERDGATILWIPVSDSSYQVTEIAEYQAAIPPDRPLDRLRRADRNEAWVQICQLVKQAAVPSASDPSPRARGLGGASVRASQERVRPRAVREHTHPAVPLEQKRVPPARRAEKPEWSRAKPRSSVVQTGSGGVAIGDGAVVAGQGGLAIGGDVHGNINMGTGRGK